MPKARIASPYPKLAALITKFENTGELSRKQSVKFRGGLFPKPLKWLTERPETLLALYEDIMEQRNGKEKET
jgi:hypothetical protein